MKKLLGLIFILLLFSAKSYSQTKQFPFYGFELSNYEVGDTLEYEHGYGYQYNIDCTEYDFYIIINKETFSGSDSIKYTYRFISYGYCSGAPSVYESADTIISVVNNDTVYNNKNNLLQYKLQPFYGDTTGLVIPYDSSYVRFDTVNGLKTLVSSIRSIGLNYGYEAIENMGITNNYQFLESGGIEYLKLIYAHLTHYGTYGKYQEIILGINNITSQASSISIRYTNGQPILFISSTQNLSSSTLSIYDLLGRELQTIPVTVGNNLLNLNSLAKGMYLYKVTSNGNIIGQGKLMNI